MFTPTHQPLPPVLCQWKTFMMGRGLRPRTIDERIRIVQAISSDLAVIPQDLSAADVLGWLANKRTPNTRWSYFVQLHAFFRWLVLAGIRLDDPLAVIPAPRRPKNSPRPVDHVHIVTVLSSRLRFRTRVMIMLAAWAGLRVHEIAKLHGHDWDQATGLLTVEGKGGRIDVIPLHPAIQSLIASMPQDDWWFPSPGRNGHVTSRAVGATIVRAFARHDIPMTAHQLRHSFGTSLVEAGIDIRIAQTLMRHESIATTALYVRITRDQQTKALQQLTIP